MDFPIFRTRSGSFPVQTPPLPSSPRHSISLPITDSAAGENLQRAGGHISLPSSGKSMPRAYSEPDLFRSLSATARSFSTLRSRSFTSLPPRMIPEEGGRNNNNKNYNNPLGGGDGRNDDGGDDKSRIGAYYQDMLSTDPTNPLLLMNYGKYLHEVEKDMVKAEEYYGRAILANPGGDGEVLSLYARLTWETHKDKTRANCYFTQAVQASPNDSTILGSYAHFLWEAEENEQVEQVSAVSGGTPMVQAF